VPVARWVGRRIQHESQPYPWRPHDAPPRSHYDSPADPCSSCSRRQGAG
jgi:hypothetical protein